MNWSNEETGAVAEMLDNLALSIDPAVIAYKAVRFYSNGYAVADIFLPKVIAEVSDELYRTCHEQILRRVKVSPGGCLNEFTRSALRRSVDAVDWHQLARHHVGEQVKELKASGFRRRHPEATSDVSAQ
jgi:hypothetical protein